MNFNDAQSDMRQAYLGGGPGALASGLVWVLAGIVALMASQFTSMLTLFFGGMFIFPLGLVFVKILGSSGKHQSSNPLGMLAIETTFILILGLIIAFAIAKTNPVWFFPTVLLIIGGRYLVFSTIYGMRIYWLLGILLISAGLFLAISLSPFHYGAFAGGAIEIIFAFIITRMTRKIET